MISTRVCKYNRCICLIGMWAFSLAMSLLLPVLASCSQPEEKVVNLKIVQTGDIHGNFFPYDFIQESQSAGSLSRLYSYVRQVRSAYQDNLLLLDNGDMLQGQPAVYYYNYIDTVAVHLAADVMNFMGYSAGNMGNHDIEAGHRVFDRWARQCHFPILGANIVDTATGLPYFKPYQVFCRQGAKVVVLGMITPAIPVWLAENLWQGLRFEDMEASARHWMKVIQEKERPDVVIGLFHAGRQACSMAGRYRDNASLEVAERVPGFDMVLMGHDHDPYCGKICNVAGDSVLVLDPANNGCLVADIDVKLKLRKGKVVGKQLCGKLVSTDEIEVSDEFMEHFATSYSEVNDFVSKKIATFATKVSSNHAYFGSSAFVDLIHSFQLDLSGADISFVAPLSYSSVIDAGDVSVSDMFKLYKYENRLYTMLLSGREVHGALEMSYALWTDRMKKADDHLLLLRADGQGQERGQLRNMYFNFDSAAGIVYTVDVTKPEGEKVAITGMADGTPFDMDKIYRVAVNSYRGNGGGELLTKGAGIPWEQLRGRVLASTDKDIRYHLMKYFEQVKRVEPRALHQWKFVPEEWTLPAARRDYELLFGGFEK